ncbi:MAG: hypothetical protein E5V34_06750 [Mesorhizobium sp.]|nr:MAG: hypothetical protein E5V34_06750 [Mesorhizobium sp.]
MRNLKARFSGEQIKDVITPYVSLKASWSNTPTEFRVGWNFQTLETEVPAKAIVDYLKSVDDIADNLQWQYEDPPLAKVKVRDPAMEQRQVIASMFLLSLLVGVPFFIAYRRSRHSVFGG